MKVEEWLMWQMAGLGPMSGQASHFRLYAPTIEPDETKTAYGRERYTNEVNRLYGVMDRQLAQTPFLAGAYSIADMASWPWVRGSKLFGQNLDDFPHLKRWFDEIGAREAVKRGGGAGQELRQATNAATTPGARSMLFGQTAQSIQEEADKAKR